MSELPFYGDALERFNAMANSENESVDGVHFRMWCKIAAEEIGALRAAFRVNMLRVNPEISHETFDRFFAGLVARENKALTNE